MEHSKHRLCASHCTQVVAADAVNGTPSLAPCLESERKRLATLQARTALWGGSLTATDGDNGRPMFVVTRWALTRAFDSLDEVGDWLQRVGVPG